MLKEQVRQGVLSNQDLKDERLKHVTSLTWETLQEASDTLNKILDDIPLKNMDEQDFSVALKLTTILSDLSAALHLLTGGFQHPAAVIQRAVTESLSVIVAIRTNDQLFTRFKKNDLDKPKTVTKASKVFEPLGLLYGQLTQKYTHEPYVALGRATVDLPDGKTAVLLVPPVDRNGFLPQFSILLILASLAEMLSEISEWYFAASLENFRHWDRDTDGNLKTLKTRSKTCILEISNAVENVLKTPLSNGG